MANGHHPAISIGRLSRGGTLPDSVSPGQVVEVLVTIEPSLVGTANHVTLEVIGQSVMNGTAAVVGNPAIQDSGPIQVRGGDQTEVGRGGRLYIQAFLDGVALANSAPFSVCAHPTAVESHYVKNVITDLLLGISVEIILLSDSGNNSHLDQIEFKEEVSQCVEHSASLEGKPANTPNQNNDFKKAAIITHDTHAIPVAQATALDQHKLHGSPGHFSNYQLDLFKCLRCSMKSPAPIPQSGYKLTRIIFTRDGQLMVRILKEPSAHMFDEYNVEAGPSPDIDSGEMTVPKYAGQLPPPPAGGSSEGS